MRPSEGSRPYAELVRDASSSATVIEVRATDRAGLLYALGKSLRIKITAEGVETEAQLGLLQQENCDLVQGYLLGKPMAKEDLGTLLVAASATGTLVANARNTLGVSASLQANTNYWLVFNTNGRSSGGASSHTA